MVDYQNAIDGDGDQKASNQNPLLELGDQRKLTRMDVKMSLKLMEAWSEGAALGELLAVEVNATNQVRVLASQLGPESVKDRRKVQVPSSDFLRREN